MQPDPLVSRSNAGIHDRQSSLAADYFLLTIFDSLQDLIQLSICERLNVMSRVLKQQSEVSRNMRLESQDSRESILDILDTDDAMRGVLSLALVLDDQGHPKHAEEAYRKVIGKRKETLGHTDRVVLFCQRKVSSILRQGGLYREAEDQGRRVLDLSIKATGPTSSLSLHAAGDLALVWRDQGHFDLAFTKIRNILDNETCSPYQDALHLRLVTILAIILRDCGHYAMSLFLTRNVLRISGALFGDKDPFTLDLASELSQTLTEAGNHHLAEEFARRALDGFSRIFGTDHPQSLKAASRLANAIRFDERLEDATRLFERTLKAQELQLGPNHPDTVPTKCGLAATYALEARFRDSLSLLRPTLAQQNALFGRNSHPDTDWTLQALQRIRAFQRASRTEATSESELEDQSRKTRDFFKKPFRKDQRSFDAIPLILKNTVELRLQSESPPLSAARGVSIDLKKGFSSSLGKIPVSGLYGTTLHAACFRGNLQAVQLLLNLRTNVDVEGGLFETPLCAASYGGHIRIVELLLKHGVNLKDYGQHGFRALQLALSMGHNDLARTLLRAGANHEVTDHWYGNTLHEAAMTGQESMVNLLLEAKANPNAVTGIFGTALGAAAWAGNLTIVEALIRKGAVVNTQVEGRSPLDLAASRGHEDIIEALIREVENSNEALTPEVKSETLEQKSLEPDRAVVEDSKPEEQSELLEQKRPKPPSPQSQTQANHPSSTKSSEDSLSFGAGKTEARKKQAGKKTSKLRNVAKSVTSGTKSLIPSSDRWVGRVRDSRPKLKKGTPSP